MAKKNKNEEDTMVLRTVYLPVRLDEALKKLAVRRDVSKGQLIRDHLTGLVDKPQK